MPRSPLVFIQWLRGILLPCPFKYFTGIDCPGCGFQRSMLALFQGNLHESFWLYPSTLPLLLAALFTLADQWLKLDTSHHYIKKSIYIFTGCCILISYTLKMLHVYNVPS